MIHKDVVAELRKSASGWKGPVLTAVLSVDPSQTSNISGGFVARYRTAIQRLEHRLDKDAKQKKLLLAASQQVESQLREYVPNAKTLVIIRDGASGDQWKREFRIPMTEAVEWSEFPYLLPLLEAFDEHERFAVALTNRERSKIFVVHAGEANEVSDLAAQDVGRKRTTGFEHSYSEANFHRRVDGHAARHARETADALAEIVDRFSVDRILLAGAEGATAAVEHVLPKRLRRKLAGSVKLLVDASAADVIRVVDEVGAAAERKEEGELVADLVNAASRGDHAVLGLKPTVEAARESSIARLVVAGDYHPDWENLPELEVWLRSDAPGRPDDLLESLAEKTLQRGGRVEFVWGEAAKALNENGAGIGAFVRF